MVSQFFNVKPVKLEPCALAGLKSGAELFIVEGDSASSAVCGVRSQHFQAVLPMQGKPLNALRASAQKVAAFGLYQSLSQALGVSSFDSIPARSAKPEHAAPDALSLSGLCYDRVLLLFDPDADGIHCGALMLMYFYRWMRPLLASGRVEMVRAPLFEIRWTHNKQPCVEPAQAYSEEHHRGLCEELRRRGAQEIKTHRYRGLGNINPALLAQTCVNPASRRTSVMGLADALQSIEAFGPNRLLQVTSPWLCRRS